MMMTISIKQLVFLVAMLLSSCGDPSPNIDSDADETSSKYFDIQWVSLLNGAEGANNHNNGIVHNDQYIFFGHLRKKAHIYAFDKLTGDRQWEYKYDGWDNTDIEYNYYHDGIILCITGKRVFGFDIETQIVLWEENLHARNMLRSAGIVGADSMFYMVADENFSPAGGFTGHLLQFDPFNGAMELVASYGPDSTGTKGLSPPVVWRDNIVVYNMDTDVVAPPEQSGQFLIAYDMYSKEELWRTRVRDTYASNGLHPPVIYDDRIVITGSGWSIYGFDVETGEQLWRYDLPGFNSGGNFWITTNHLIHGDKLFVNELGEYVACLDPRTGEEIWLNKKGGANCTENMYYYEQEDALVLTAWGYGSVMILDGTTGETIHREHEYEFSPYGDDPVYDPETDMFFTCTYYHAVAFKVKRPD